MPIIDERGRVFGRLNLVDAAVGLLMLALLPAAYLSYVLFKDPVPVVTSVVPSVLPHGANQQVEVRGEHFRPYMRVSFNDTQGRTFLFYGTTSAFVGVPDLPPGTYDIVLYDYMQEVSRLRGAFTLDAPPPPPTIPVEVSGFLTSVTPELVKGLQVGYRFPEDGAVYAELLGRGSLEQETLHIKTGERSTMTIPAAGLFQLPVRLRMRCVIEKAPDGVLRCAANGVPLVTDANIGIPAYGKTLNLRIDEVTAASR
jgi:Domain of unknown function (DUF4330)